MNKTHVIYNIDTTRFLRLQRGGARCFDDAIYPSLGAAKAGLTRHYKKHPEASGEYAIADLDTYTKEIEKQVTVRNLMSGAKVTQSVNTPACCDPSTETYWSM